MHLPFSSSFSARSPQSAATYKCAGDCEHHAEQHPEAINSITTTFNKYEPIEEESEPEDDLTEDDYRALEELHAQMTEERTSITEGTKELHARMAEERAFILMAQTQHAMFGGTRALSSEPKTTDSTPQSNPGFWGHSFQR